jgi:hypothetical protein
MYPRTFLRSLLLRRLIILLLLVGAVLEAEDQPTLVLVVAVLAV